jgi:hypothetical protein
MPLDIVDFPSNPECGGTQWAVTDEDQLGTLVALVMVGRSQMAVRFCRVLKDRYLLRPQLSRSAYVVNSSLRLIRSFFIVMVFFSRSFVGL